MMSEEEKEKARIRAREWYQKNKERAKAAAQQRRESRSEEQKEEDKSYNKNYREQNRDKIAEKTKERYANSPGKKRLEDIKWKYGLTEEQYKKLFDDQEGKCPICKIAWKHYFDRDICVDHDHDTNQVRGLLHSKCNLALGNVNSVEEHDGLIDYHIKKNEDLLNG